MSGLPGFLLLVVEGARIANQLDDLFRVGNTRGYCACVDRKMDIVISPLVVSLHRGQGISMPFGRHYAPEMQPVPTP